MVLNGYMYGGGQVQSGERERMREIDFVSSGDIWPCLDDIFACHIQGVTTGI